MKIRLSGQCLLIVVLKMLFTWIVGWSVLIRPLGLDEGTLGQTT